MTLKGKTVLITGASSGIGAALAREYAQRGAHLILVARRLDRLEALAAQLRSPDRKVLVYSVDLTRDGDLAKILPIALQETHSLDIVIANAGFGVVGAVELLQLDDYRRQFEINVFGVLRTVQAVLPALKRSRGRLALVGSVNGYISLPNNSAYAMSKFAVRALADSLWYELARYGISVTHIAPGFVASEIRQVDNRGRFLDGAKDPIPPWMVASADRAARIIARAIAWRRRERSITAHGWWIIRLIQHFPSFCHYFIRLFGVSARREPG